MANSDKNIVITPNRGQTGLPEISFTGFGNVPITLKCLDDAYGTLSFEASSGQLLSLNNNLTDGTIFSVNDVSGIPSIRVDADGTIGFAEYMGNIGIGASSPTAQVHQVATTASTVGHIIQQHSTPGDFVQYKDHLGNILASIDSSGNITATSISSSGNIFESTSISDVPLIVRGFTGQTAALTQWQNSSQTVLSSITANGSFAHTATTAVPAISIAHSYNSDVITVSKGGGTGVVFNATGTSGQTSGMQFDSTDVSTFLFNSRQFGFSSTYSTGIDSFGVYGAYLDIAQTRNTAGTNGGRPIGVYARVSTTALAPRGYGVWAVSNSARSVPFVAQAHSGQTESLQEWQNSSGTVLAKVNASGHFSADQYNFVSTTGYLGVGATSTYVRGTTIYLDPSGNLSDAVRINNTELAPYDTSTLNLGRSATPWQIIYGNNLTLSHSTFTGTCSAYISANNTIQFVSSALGSFLTVGPGNSINTGAQVLYSLTRGAQLGNTTGTIPALVVNSGMTSVITSTFKATASQTADLMQWQNSSAIAIATVSAKGSISAPTFNCISYSDFTSVANGAADFQYGYISTEGTYANAFFTMSAAVAASKFGMQGAAGDVYIAPVLGQNYYYPSIDIFARGGTTGMSFSVYDPVSSAFTWTKKSITAPTTTYVDNFISTPLMVLTGEGRLGIGTSNPTEKLDVVGNIKLSGNFSTVASPTMQPYIADANLNFAFYPSGTATFSGITAFGKSTATDAPYGQFQHVGSELRVTSGANGTGTTADLVFQAPTERMRIDSDTGNVGIGATIPAAKLEINTTAAATVGLIVQAASSQTANLTEWQNSSGTVLSYMTSTGKLVVPELQVTPTASNTPFTLTNGDSSTGSANRVQVAFGYNGGTTYSHFITTRHNNGTSDENAIDFYTSDGTVAGVYPTNAVLGLSINGGRVGVGTTNPGQELEVNGDILLGATTSTLYLGNDSDQYITGDATSNYIALSTGNQERVRIISSGNVGIGATSPISLLEVKAADGAVGTITVGGGNATVTAVGEINSQLDFRSNDASVASTNNIGGRIASVTELTNGANTGLAFYTYAQGATAPFSEKMRITGSGYVGIGTTSPSYLFHVRSDLTGAAPIALIDWSNSINNGGAYGLVVKDSGSTFFNVIGIKTSGSVNVGFGFTAGSSFSGNSTAFDSHSFRCIPQSHSSGTSRGLYLNQVATGSGTARINLLDLTMTNSSAGSGGNWLIVGNSSSTEVFNVSAAGGGYFAGTVGIGETSPGAKLQINTVAAATKGLIVKAAASQTANLQEWQNSSGTALAYVDKDGYASFSGGITTGSAKFISLTRTIPVVVNDVVQIGSFAFTNGAGDLSISIIIPSSGFSVAKKYHISSKYGFATSWSIVLPDHDTGAYGGVHDVQLEAVQTAGTLSLRIRRSAGTVAGTAYITIIDNGASTSSFTPSTATSTEATTSLYFPSTALVNLGSKVGIGISVPTAHLHQVINAATTVGHVIKSASSQTANLTEWQNSSSTVLASVSSSGGITAATVTSNGTLTVKGRIQTEDSSLSAVRIGYNAAPNASSIPDTIAIGSGTMTSATIVSNTIAIGSNALYTKTTSGNGCIALGISALYGCTSGAQNIAVGNFVLSDVTTGTGNTAIGHLTGDGITTGSYNTIIGANVQGLSATLANTIIIADGQGNKRIYVDSDGEVGLGTESPGAKLEIETGSTTRIGLIVQAIASQTANLTEWQDSTGTVLSKIASDGKLTVPTFAMTTGASNGYVLTSDGSGNATWQVGGGSGTVTSVALALPSIFTVSGSPVTTSGTLTGTLASQTANTVFVAPNGSAGAPTFRALVKADLPSTVAHKDEATTFTSTLAASNLSGTNTGDQTITLTGDVTGSGTGSFAATIASSVVTFAKMQNITTGKLLGRSTASTGVIEELSVGTGLSLSAGTLSSTITQTNSSGIAGAVQFSNGSNGFNSDATNFFWDDTNNRLGIKTGSPGHELQIGTTTSTATATPVVLSLGGTYSSTAGSNLKLRLYDPGVSSTSYGIGVSASQLDFVSPASAGHAFFVNGSASPTLTIKSTSLIGIGMGSSTPGAQVEINTSSASTIGLIVQGASSQTANLTEWQNSSSTVLASVSSSGGLTAATVTSSGTLTANGRIQINDNTGVRIGGDAATSSLSDGIVAIGYRSLYSAILATNTVAIGKESLYSKTTSGNGCVAIGYWSQYACTSGAQNTSIGNLSLNELTTGSLNISIGHNSGDGITTGSYNTIIGCNITGLSASLSNTIIIADGQGNKRIYVDSDGEVGLGTESPGARLEIETGLTTRIGLIVQAAASQTANLTEWQDSSGTVLSKVASDGKLTVPSFAITTGASNGYVLTSDASGNATWQAGGGGGSGTVTSVGLALPSIFTVSGSPVTTSGTLTGTLASQTANTVFVAPNGSAGAPTFRALVKADLPSTVVYNDQANNITGGTQTITSNAVGTKPLVIKAVSSQTANLTEWQNSSNTVLSCIDESGKLGINIADPLATFHLNQPSTGTHKQRSFLISGNGLVSGTDSSSGVLFALGFNATGNRQFWLVDSEQTNSTSYYGFRYIVGFGLPLIDAIRTDGVAQGSINLTVNVDASRVGIGFSTSDTQASVSAKLHVKNSAAATKAMIVQGFASQTGNLQEWQNSGGTALASVASDGKLTIPSLQVTTGASSGYVLTSDGSGNATWQAGSGSGSGKIAMDIAADDDAGVPYISIENNLKEVLIVDDEGIGPGNRLSYTDSPTFGSLSESGDAYAGTSFSINKPTGTTSGDLLVLIVGSDASGTPGWSCTGFTVLESDSRSAVLYKTAGGSEPASYTVSGTYIEASAIMYRFSGTNAIESSDITYVNADTAATQPDPGFLDPGSLYIVWGYGESDSTWTNKAVGNPSPATGWNSHYRVDSSSALLTSYQIFDTEGQPGAITHQHTSAYTTISSGYIIISGTTGTSTDSSGIDLVLHGGPGTGTGNGGDIVLRTAPASGSSGTTINTQVNRVTIDSDGNVILHSIPSSDPNIAGAIYKDSNSFLKISNG